MRQVAITIGGKVYRLQCRPGEEPRVRDLGTALDEKLTALASETGSSVNDRLMVMAALLILDELFDLRAKVKAAGDGAEPARRLA